MLLRYLAAMTLAGAVSKLKRPNIQKADIIHPSIRA